MFRLFTLIICLYLLAYWLDRLFLKKRFAGWRSGVADLWSYLQVGRVSEATVKLNWLITQLFDEVYGVDHYSEKRLKRSVLSSIVGMLIFAYLIGFNSIINEFTFLIGDLRGQMAPSHVFIIALVSSLVPIFFNFIPDYFSLIETRMVLNLAGNKGALAILLLIVVDVLLTTFIFLIGVVIYMALFHVLLLSDPAFAYLLNVEKDMSFVESIQSILSSGLGKVFFLTTYMTSFLWIIFVITYYMILFFSKNVRITYYFINRLSSSDRPATILTTFLVLFILGIYGIYLLL